jgi:hypothetical protein
MAKKGKHSGYTELGAIQFRRLRKGDIEWCSNEHYIPKHKDKRSPNAGSGSRKNATHTVFILGLHSAYVCAKCRKEWIDTWKKYSPIEYA